MSKCEHCGNDMGECPICEALRGEGSPEVLAIYMMATGVHFMLTAITEDRDMHVHFCVKHGEALAYAVESVGRVRAKVVAAGKEAN